MEDFDLSGIPANDRELMRTNQRQVTEILEEIERLKVLGAEKTTAGAKARKRLTAATRVLADVISTPELFVNYKPTKNIKYLAEGYYGVGKRFLEDMQLDPKGLTGGKSSMHHNDSLKQLFGALYHPDPNVRYKILQELRSAKGGDIGSTLANLSDTEAKYGHREYHKSLSTGLTDWANKDTTVKGIDVNSSLKERVAKGIRSMEGQGKITKAAQESDIVIARNMSMLADFAETPEGLALLEKFGNPLDIDNPKRTVEAIQQFRNLNTQFTTVIENGSVRFKAIVNKPGFKVASRFAPAVAGMSILGDIAQAAEGTQALKQDKTTKVGKLKEAKAKTDIMAGVSGVAATLAPVTAPITGAMSLISAGGSMILGARIAKEEKRSRTPQAPPLGQAQISAPVTKDSAYYDPRYSSKLSAGYAQGGF